MIKGASSKKHKRLIGCEDFGILKEKERISRKITSKKVNHFLFVDNDCSKEFYS